MKMPGSGAKRKLLDAAAGLVARDGFDAVSVRDVTGAAGANVAAVNYHFGSREGLMRLVISSVLEPLCARRIAALDAAGKSAKADSLLRAYVSAVAEAAAETGTDGDLFASLAGRILALPSASLPADLAAMRGDVGDRYLAAISSPSSKVRPVDWAFFEAGLAQSLIAEAGSGKIPALLDDWAAFGTRAFAAAASPKKKRDDSQGFLFDL